MSSVHGITEVAAEASSVVGVVASCSEGAETSSTEGETMATDEMETDSGGDTRSTSLAKRECYIFLAREVLRMFCLVCRCYLNIFTTKHLTL
jgi:hypothetical protein